MGWYTPQSVAPDLSDILVCGWTACAEGEHLLVPDACMDVLWIRGVGIRVCGPETAAWSFTLPPGTRSVGVRFRPGSASPMLRTSASELRDSRADLSTVTDARTERILLNRLENSEDHEQVSDPRKRCPELGKFEFPSRSGDQPCPHRTVRTFVECQHSRRRGGTDFTPTPASMQRRLRIRPCDAALDPAPPALHGARSQSTRIGPR